MNQQELYFLFENFGDFLDYLFYDFDEWLRLLTNII